MDRFVTIDSASRRFERPEPLLRVNPPLYGPVVLLDSQNARALESSDRNRVGLGQICIDDTRLSSTVAREQHGLCTLCAPGPLIPPFGGWP